MDLHTKVLWIFTYVLFAANAVVLGVALWFAYAFTQLPLLSDGDPILVGFPVRITVKETVIVATSSENLPAVGTTTP